MAPWKEDTSRFGQSSALRRALARYGHQLRHPDRAVGGDRHVHFPTWSLVVGPVPERLDLQAPGAARRGRERLLGAAGRLDLLKAAPRELVGSPLDVRLYRCDVSRHIDVHASADVAAGGPCGSLNCSRASEARGLRCAVDGVRETARLWCFVARCGGSGHSATRIVLGLDGRSAPCPGNELAQSKLLVPGLPSQEAFNAGAPAGRSLRRRAIGRDRRAAPAAPLHFV